jgi:hypothetical protein
MIFFTNSLSITMKKIFVLLTTVLLLASCAKKEAGNTPPEGAKPPAAKAGGHPSGGSITQINPPGVTGGQAGAISATIQPTGHTDPALDGNPTIVIYETKLPNVVMTVKYSTTTDSTNSPVFPNQLNTYTLQPMTDTTKVMTYSLVFRRNGVPLSGAISAPSNTAANNGFQVTNYYSGAIGQMASNAVWVMIADQSLMK